LTLGAGFFLVALRFGPKVLTAVQDSGGRRVDNLMLLVVLVPFLSGFIFFAVAALGRARAVLRCLRRQEAPPRTVTFRRPEALRDVADAYTILRVTVEAPLFRMFRSYLRVETPTGRVLALLGGHSESSLKKLSHDLRKHLLSPRSTIANKEEAS
jgi:hypothetical protein